MKNIIQSLKVVSLGLIVAVGISYAFSAGEWNPPTANPPLANTDTPINSGASIQEKVGPVYFINGAGIGFGKDTPLVGAEKLKVNGGLKVNGEIKTDWIHAESPGVNSFAGSVDVTGTIIAKNGIVLSNVAESRPESRPGSLSFDGTDLLLHDGTSWKKVSGGAVASPTPTCASFTYTAWSPSPCPSSQTQTRNVTASSPSGCIGGSPETTRTCTYTKVLPTVNLYITDTDKTIPVGYSTTVAWRTSNAISCVASGGWSGSKALSASQVITPNSTTTYTLTCTNADGSTSASQTVTVKQWQNTTGQGNVGDTCDLWLTRTGQKGVDGSGTRTMSFRGDPRWAGHCVYQGTSNWFGYPSNGTFSRAYPTSQGFYCPDDDSGRCAGSSSYVYGERTQSRF